jgi:hypothetical protein
VSGGDAERCIGRERHAEAGIDHEHVLGKGTPVIMKVAAPAANVMNPHDRPERRCWTIFC